MKKFVCQLSLQASIFVIVFYLTKCILRKKIIPLNIFFSHFFQEDYILLITNIIIFTLFFLYEQNKSK